MESVFFLAEIMLVICPSRLDTRGVRVVTNVGRDAMDASAHA